ncbi:MAG: endonuclease III [Methylococcales bacterium]|nr:endonuclease III [Methylococcales bacterium]
MNVQQISRLFEQLAFAIPQPKTELVYSSDFELLISVVLSAQATDKSVNKATAKLFAVANTPEKILQLGEESLKEYIKTIGLFNTKAKNIILLCQKLLEKHDGQVPQTRAELESLAGVGRKTANVMLNTAFGEPTIAVDTHIFRVANRIGLANGNTVLAVEKELERVIPEKFKLDAHHLLILHGRYTCMARKPLCEQCVISNYCEFFLATKH